MKSIAFHQKSSEKNCLMLKISRPVAHEQENGICGSTGCCCSVQADRGAVLAAHSNWRAERDGMGEVSPLTLATTFLLFGGNWRASHILCVTPHPAHTPDMQGNYHLSQCQSPGLQGPSSLSGHRTRCSSQGRRRRSAHTIRAPPLMPGWSKSVTRHIPEPCCTPDRRWQGNTSSCYTAC